MAIGDGKEFKLVGFKNFVRTNPRSTGSPSSGSTMSSSGAALFSWGLGMSPIACSDLSTGSPFFASAVLHSGDLVFAFTAPYTPTISADAASPFPLPAFSAAAANRFLASHDSTY